jgi:hypothetical protein
MSYYGSGSASDPGEQPPAGNSTALVVLLVSVLVVVLCGGGVGTLYLIGLKDRPPAVAGGVTNGSPGASTNPGVDTNSIVKGQCVVNDGSKEAPVLRVVTCAPGTFKVLDRIDGTIDTNKCKQVPGANFHYFYDTLPNSLDFVLCLKQQ